MPRAARWAALALAALLLLLTGTAFGAALLAPPDARRELADRWATAWDDRGCIADCYTPSWYGLGHSCAAPALAARGTARDIHRSDTMSCREAETLISAGPHSMRRAGFAVNTKSSCCGHQWTYAYADDHRALGYYSGM